MDVSRTLNIHASWAMCLGPLNLIDVHFMLPFDIIIWSAETIASYPEISNAPIFWFMQMDL